VSERERDIGTTAFGNHYIEMNTKAYYIYVLQKYITH